MLQPALQHIDGCRVTVSQYFDATVVEIPRMTGKAKAQGFSARGGAEEHALHATLDEEPRRAHGLAPMALDRSAAVIGPTNFFATLPSGAIR